MLKRSVVPVALLALASCAPASGSGVAATVTDSRAADSITADAMLERISFLASDEMMGRNTTSPGQEAAVRYIEEQYSEMGLEPAGDNGSFIQRYAFQERGVRPGPSAAPSMAPNVVAILRGSDPELRDEYVVLSAHLDHVGVGNAVAGDSIYNGADDNASGTAGLLEVAKAFAEMEDKPRRSIIFLHVSGEEHGLLGSRHFSDNPTVPIDDIIANINVDMISRNSPDSIVVIGKNYSSLGEVVNSVGLRHPELGLTVSDDLWPDERFFFRSDHFNFARLDIPALFFFSGVHEDYHRPSDSADKIDPDKAARVARLIFYTAQDIANSDSEPRWDPRGLAEVRSMVR